MATLSTIEQEMKRRGLKPSTGSGPTATGTNPAGGKPKAGGSAVEFVDMYSALKAGKSPSKSSQEKVAAQTDRDMNWYDPIRSGLRGGLGDLGDMAGAGVAAGAAKAMGDEKPYGDIYNEMKGSIDDEEAAFAESNPDLDRNMQIGGTLASSVGGLGLAKSLLARGGAKSAAGAALNAPNYGQRLASGAQALSTGGGRAATSAAGAGANAARTGAGGLKRALQAAGRGAKAGAKKARDESVIAGTSYAAGETLGDEGDGLTAAALTSPLGRYGVKKGLGKLGMSKMGQAAWQLMNPGNQRVFKKTAAKLKNTLKRKKRRDK